MVRVNLIDPEVLADQHLIAEYREILMLAGYIRRHPFLVDIPTAYTLGKGHMRFFKDKLGYLKKRHERIRIEMKRRGFTPHIRLSLEGFSKGHLGQWSPAERDIQQIKRRLMERILKKPQFYRYASIRRPISFWREKMGHI